MVVVTTPQADATANENPQTDWTQYLAMPSCRAKKYPAGAVVGGVMIPASFYAVLTSNGTIRSVDPITFEASYIVP